VVDGAVLEPQPTATTVPVAMAADSSSLLRIWDVVMS
jgi:hypothetical protein